LASSSASCRAAAASLASDASSWATARSPAPVALARPLSTPPSAGLFQRKAAGSSPAAQAALAEQAQAALARTHGIAVSTSAPLGEFDRTPQLPGFAPPLWEWVAADPTLASTFASAAATVSDAAAAASAPQPLAGQDRWPNERGLNVLVLRLEDLKVVYDRTFDTFGFKRKSAAECAALLAAAAPEGELGTEGPLRWRWRDHLVVVTSAGTGWEAPPDSGIEQAVQQLATTLGIAPVEAQALSRAALIGPLNKSGGRSLSVAALCGSGGRPRGFSCSSPTGRAVVRLALACDEGGWFPTFVQSSPNGRWAPCWRSWGDEPWGLAPGAAESERRRVERYLLLLDELGPLLGRGQPPAAASSGQPRAQLEPLLRCLAEFSLRHMAQRGWPLLRAARADGSHPEEADSSGSPSSAAREEERPRRSRGDELVCAFEMLLDGLLEPKPRQAAAASDATGCETEAEIVQAGCLEWLCARLGALAAAFDDALFGCSAADAATNDAAIAAAAEGRRVCRTLSRCLLAANGALVAEGVRRGVVPPLLEGVSRWWPAPPYSASQPPTWASPQPGDVEDLLSRCAALDVSTLQLQLRPAGEAASEAQPLSIACIRTGLLQLRARGSQALSRDGLAQASGPLHVVTYTPPKKGVPTQLLPDRPSAAALAKTDAPEAAPSTGEPAAGARAAKSRCFEGGIVVLRARDAAAHASLVLHAPRLVHLAASQGALGCVFLAPLLHGSPLVRPLLPNPNLETPSSCCSVVLPHTPEVEAALEQSALAPWTASLQPGSPSPWGAAADIHAALAPRLRLLVAGADGGDAAALTRGLSAGQPRTGEQPLLPESPSGVSMRSTSLFRTPSLLQREAEPGEEGGSPDAMPLPQSPESVRVAGADCWDASGGALLPAGEAAAALATALSSALQLAETGDVAGAAAAAATAAVSFFSANSWTAEHAAGAEAAAVDPIKEAAFRLIATLSPSSAPATPPPAASAAPAAAAQSPPSPSALQLIAASPPLPGTPPLEDPVRTAAARILSLLGAVHPSGAAPASSAERPVRILSLDGGGVRGLVEIAVLRRLLAGAATVAAAQGQPAPHLCDLFDIVVGTSTGGVIALGAVLGMPLDELEQVYRETAAVIFKPESYSSLLRSACFAQPRPLLADSQPSAQTTAPPPLLRARWKPSCAPAWALPPTVRSPTSPGAPRSALEAPPGHTCALSRTSHHALPAPPSCFARTPTACRTARAKCPQTATQPRASPTRGAAFALRETAACRWSTACAPLPPRRGTWRRCACTRTW